MHIAPPHIQIAVLAYMYVHIGVSTQAGIFVPSLYIEESGT